MYLQLYSEVKRNVNEYFTPEIDPDTTGYVNQHGLSRKVRPPRECAVVGY